MKDLNKSWEAWQGAEEPPLLDEAFLNKALQKKSVDPLVKLKKNVKAKLLLIAFFSLLFLVIILSTDKVYNKILMSPLILAYLVGLVLIFGQYRILNFVDKNLSLKETLEIYYLRISQISKYEQRVALFIYPVSITAGFVYGFTMNRDVEDILSDQRILSLLIALNLVLVPACYYLARWMDYKAFGTYLEHLKEDLNQLNAA
ncbi:hypothetical protein [Catalinimonas niigatensis]|uniref:hypothetical protein n=1 Tax=Catalinimonas niigatensis TaxID=1397264 RepID=UPI0026657C8E|nr:hypothetical protein [Catalinimonas niigatensis]WPP48197.1 hypothetical protein PZB72_16120 [Catalinimonas niigatensis]